MFGSGSFPGDRPLTGKIKDEIQSALRLLLKNVSQQAVDLSFPTAWTAYLTDIPCESAGVALKPTQVEVSADPIRALPLQAQHVHQQNLLAEVRLAEAAPCQMEPVVCEASVLEDMSLNSFGVSFENFTLAESQAWAVEELTTPALQQPVEGFAEALSAEIPAGVFLTRAHALHEMCPAPQIFNDARFYALPIKKAPIPPHRFPAAAKEKFRQVLAEKAGTHPNNVQLRVIFERLDMTLFAGIQQDEQGNLLCIPKNELLGKNQALLNRQQTLMETTYLVYGLRLDTGEDIRSLVPAGGITGGFSHE